MSSSSSSSKICFNKDCKELKSEPPRPGWKLRGVGYAQLCDRCGSLFDEGRFCDTFHSNAAGWSCCESCGKRIHCGCIASAHAFALLDAGGIECVACAKKNTLLAPNTPWPPCFPQTSNPERLKDFSTRNWTQLVGSGPVPWRQAPTLFSSSIQSELHPRAPNEVELSTGFGVPSLEKRKIEDFSERLSNGGPRDIHENGNAGINQEEQTGSLLNKSQQPPVKDTPSSPYFGLAVPYESLIETNGQIGVPGTHLRATIQQPTATKQFHCNSHNGNGRPRADARGRNQLLPRYWPRFTDQDLQKISGDSNSVVTPLFEKMLSASDAGRIGRLVLPKKCAEAYFPAISQPEGLPLKVQDSKGKEWIFQFRFWPNNNSRMYVLEGVTPCIQNMQLQAGDIVTFSRLEPEGKLVMGFRKASTASASDQDNGTNKSTTGVSMNGDVEMADPSVWAKVDKSGYIATEALGLKSSIPRKRKNTTLGSKSKRLKIENEDLIELKITWQEAQGQLRPPENHVPSVLVIEGYEFEEYEEAPTLGKPTIFATDTAGEKNQWVQCEDCSKWRKLPANALLPPKWTCLNNSWDPERSSCSAPQELRTEQLEDLLPLCNSAVSKKTKSAKLEPENIESMEGLDTLANLAILGESDTPPSLSSSQATTKHPRHRPGCSCIVCIQPPSGKGPKHKPSCTCNVCQTVKRRFHTLMMRREKKQSEKEAETSRKKLMLPMPPPPQQKPSVPEEDSKLAGDDSLPCNKVENNSPNQKKVVSDGSDDDASRMMKSSNSPFNIDLNIKPERDEEQLSPGSESSSMMRLLQDAERYLKQQRLSSSANNTNNLVASQPLLGGGTEEKINNITVNSSLQDKDNDHHGTLSINASASVSAT